MLLEYCDEKEVCLANTWHRKNARYLTFSAGANETEIDFVLVSKENRKYLRDVKVIPWELQHRLLVVDVDKRKQEKVMKKESVIKEEFGS